MYLNIVYGRHRTQSAMRAKKVDEPKVFEPPTKVALLAPGRSLGGPSAQASVRHGVL